MTPDDYVVTAIASDFADHGRLALDSFLSGYYAESIRIIHEAHLAECTASDGDLCLTCEAIRAGLVGILAERRSAASLNTPTAAS
ncbi:hypothetical protein [Micromonospora inositola]|nr:hypothetical protein [Micromonospora inositola]